MKSEIGLKNFEEALKKLKEFSSLPVKNERDQAGIIQAFEFTFEACWKAIQKKAEAHQIQVGSPKQAFQAAFQLGWIPASDQENWLQMLQDRNLTSRTYKEKIAQEVLSFISKKHIGSFEKMARSLKTNS